MTRLARPSLTMSETVAVDARPMRVTVGGQEGKLIELRSDEIIERLPARHEKCFARFDEHLRRPRPVQEVPAHAVAVSAYVEHSEQVAFLYIGKANVVRDDVPRVRGTPADIRDERVRRTRSHGAHPTVCAVDGRAGEIRGGGVYPYVPLAAPLLDRAHAREEHTRASD